MALAYFKRFVVGKDVHVFSAGLAAYPGMPPSPQAVKVMSFYDVDLSHHLSQALTTNLVEEADLLIVMTEGHRDWIIRQWPQAKDKVFLLLEFAEKYDTDTMDIFDPMGFPEEVYEKCFQRMKEPLERLGAML
jgi:protein-tyrosine phosphatase